MDCRIEPKPFILRVGPSCRALSARCPDAPQHGLETQAGLILAPDLDLVLGVRGGYFGDRVVELFLNASCSAALAARR